MSTSNPIDQVGTFMETFQQPVRICQVKDLTAKEKRLRIALIAEELLELAEALGVGMTVLISTEAEVKPGIDLVAALDGLTDLRYVVYGAFHSLGLATVADKAFDEVQKSNMSKGLTCQHCGGRKQVYVEETTPSNCPVCHGSGVIAAFTEAGKIRKGPDFKQPNLEQFIVGATIVQNQHGT